MQTDYTKYTAEDFIQDDFFIRSYYYPTQTTEKFWQDQLKNGEVNAKEYHMACRYLYSVSVEKPQMNFQEKEGLKKKIFAETVFASKRSKYLYLKIAAACIFIGICSTILLSVFLKKGPENTLMGIASEWTDTISSGQIELTISDNERIIIAEENAIIEHDTKGDITINEEIWKNKKETKEKKKKRNTTG